MLDSEPRVFAIPGSHFLNDIHGLSVPASAKKVLGCFVYPEEESQRV
jgi:hypothetical protein